MARDAGQLGHERAQPASLARHLDLEQLLGRKRRSLLAHHPAHVVAAVHQRAELVVLAVLGQLLDAAVQVAKRGLRGDDLLAVYLDDQSQHAMRGRVLRPHVDDEVLGGEPVHPARHALDARRRLAQAWVPSAASSPTSVTMSRGSLTAAVPPQAS